MHLFLFFFPVQLPHFAAQNVLHLWCHTTRFNLSIAFDNNNNNWFSWAEVPLCLSSHSWASTVFFFQLKCSVSLTQKFLFSIINNKTNVVLFWRLQLENVLSDFQEILNHRLKDATFGKWYGFRENKRHICVRPVTYWTICYNVIKCICLLLLVFFCQLSQVVCSVFNALL